MIMNKIQEMLCTVFTIKQIEALKDAYLFGFWGDSEVNFSDGVGDNGSGLFSNYDFVSTMTSITFKGNRSDLENIAAYAVLFFKDKRFEVTSIVYGISNKVRSATFRVSRVVAANDRL